MDSKEIIDSVGHLPDQEDLAGEIFEPYGIYNSEMAGVIAVCRNLGIELVIESGRARGHSTYVLAKYLGPMGVEIHSVELVRDAHSAHAEQKLSAFGKYLTLHYGNSFDLIPQLLRQASGRKIGILIDGPKSRKAIDLFSECISISQDVKVGFIHDLQRLRKGVPYLSRTLVSKYFEDVFFTDDESYVRASSHLDDSMFRRADGGAVPYSLSRYKRHDEYTASYGPTIGMIFPTDVDRRNARLRGSTNTFGHRMIWTLRRLFIGDLIWAIWWDMNKAKRRLIS
jgi:hypothetical protein